MNNRKIIIFFSLIFLIPFGSNADEILNYEEVSLYEQNYGEENTLQNQIDSLKNQLTEIQSKQSRWEKYREYLPKISGYLQTGYNYNSVGEGLSTFQVKRLRLIIGGDINRFSYKIQLEGFNGVNVGSRWEKQKLIQILDAYAQYSFIDALQLRVGQFSSPLGYENYLISPLTNVTIDYACICNKMVLRNAVGYAYSDYGRDLGIMLSGNLLSNIDGTPLIQYNIALTNGHLPSVNDNNKSKDIIASLTFWPTKLWNIKMAYNWGEYTPDSFSGNIATNTYPWNLVQGNKYIPLNRFIFGTWYNNPNGWYLRGEVGYQSSSYNKIKLVDELGVYGLVAYNFSKWIPVARLDYFRDKVNPKFADNRWRGLIGCSFVANSHIKVQLNYLLSRYTETAANFSNNGKRYSSELLIMGLFSF